MFSSMLCCHLPTVTAALWGFSISRIESGGVSMGLSSSSGGWPSPRDHTGQLGERHTWHRALHCRCAKTQYRNTFKKLIHPPFTFHLKGLASPKESYRDRQTHCSHFQTSHHTAAEFKLFATWKAWNKYENTELASNFPSVRGKCNWKSTFVQSSFSWSSSLLCLHIDL